MGIELGFKQHKIRRRESEKGRQVTDASEWDSLEGDDGETEFALAHDMGAFLREHRGDPAGLGDD